MEEQYNVTARDVLQEGHATWISDYLPDVGRTWSCFNLSATLAYATKDQRGVRGMQKCVVNKD